MPFELFSPDAQMSCVRQWRISLAKAKDCIKEENKLPDAVYNDNIVYPSYRKLKYIDIWAFQDDVFRVKLAASGC